MDITKTSQVYLAEDLNMQGRKVAVKMLFSDTKNDEIAYEQLRKTEEKLLARVNHPNLVTIYASDRSDEGINYLVMEFINGKSLSALLKTRGKLDVLTAGRIIIQICDTLQAIHKTGFIYLGLDPDNIMVMNLERNDRSHIKLLNPGISQPLAEVANKQAEISTDVYAAGTIMYEMLTGTSPVKRPPKEPGDAYSHTLQPIRLAGMIELPVSLDDLILQMMSKDPEMRPHDCEEVRSRLENILNPVRKPDSGQRGAVSEQLIDGQHLSLPSRVEYCLRPDKLKKVLETLPGSKQDSIIKWLILGEEGSGKTSFLKQVLHNAETTMGTKTIYLPFAGGDYPLEILKAIVNSMTRDRKGANITSTLTDFLEEIGYETTKELVSRVTTLLEPTPEFFKLGGLTIEMQEKFIFRTIYELLMAYAIKRPVMLGFDDMDHYQRVVPNLLKFIEEHTESNPIPLGIIIVDKESNNENHTRRTMKVRMDRINDTEISAFIRKIFPTRVKDNLLKELVSLAQGEPGPAMDYCHYLNNKRGFALVDNEVLLVRPELLDNLPPRLKQRLTRRIKRLSGAPKGRVALGLLYRIFLAGQTITKASLTRILEISGRQDILKRLQSLLNILFENGFIRPLEVTGDVVELADTIQSMALQKEAARGLNTEDLLAIAHVLDMEKDIKETDKLDRISFLCEQAGYYGKAADYRIMLARLAANNLDTQSAYSNYTKTLGLLRKANMCDTGQWKTAIREDISILNGMGKYKEALKIYGPLPGPDDVRYAPPDELESLMDIAHALVNSRDYTQAIPLLMELAGRFDQSQEPIMEAYCHLLLTQMYLWRSMFKKTEKEIAHARTLLEGHPYTRIHFFLAIKQVELSLKEGNTSGVLRIISNIMPKLDDPVNYAFKAEALAYRARAFLYTGRLDEAYQTFSEGLELSKKYSSYKGMAIHRLSLIVTQFYQGQTVDNPEESLKLAHKEAMLSGDPFIEIKIQNVTTAVYILLQKWEDAGRSIHEASAMSSKHHYKYGMGLASLHQAIVDIHQNEWEDAGKAFVRAKKLLKVPVLGPKDSGYSFEATPALYYVEGRLLIHKGKWDQGRTLIEKTIEIYKSYGWNTYERRITERLEALQRQR